VDPWRDEGNLLRTGGHVLFTATATALRVRVCRWARGADVPRNWRRRGTPRQPYCFVLLDLCLGRAPACQDEHAITLVQRRTGLGVRRYVGCGGTESARASVQTESKVATVGEESKQFAMPHVGALLRHRVRAAIGEARHRLPPPSPLPAWWG
jgi:hypothetical protein